MMTGLGLRRDVSVAVRSLRKTPGVAATIVLTLALSIGATTAMFSIVNGVLLAPLPFANAERLVWTVNRGSRPYDAMSSLDLDDWRRLNDSFEAVGSYLPTSVALAGGGTTQHLSAAEVTGNWFTMLGVRMEIGRGLVPDDQGVGKPNVVVLSHRLWRSQFGADRTIVGRAILIDGGKYTVVGIAPASFDFPTGTDLWRPAGVAPFTTQCRGCRIFRGPIVLLARGVSLERARQGARIAAAQIRAQYPTEEAGLDFDLQPLREHMVGSSKRLVIVLFGAVASLLLIACANIATLLLVRASNRSTEMAIRLALGASARRVASQLLVESVLLAVVGTLLGVIVAQAAVTTIVAHEAATLPLVTHIGIDRTALAFAIGITVAAGIGFGLVPALHAARTNIVSSIKAGGRGSSVHRSTSQVRHTLIALELAVTVPLLVGSALLSESFGRLVRVDPGFRADHVVRFDVALPKCGTAWSPDTTCAGVEGPRYMTAAAVTGFARRLDERLRALPGTEGVAIVFGAPFTDWAKNQTTIAVKGLAPPPAGQSNPVENKYATPGYFTMLGIPVLQGRDFAEADRGGTPNVLIVSEGTAKAYFGGESPVGKHLLEGTSDIGEVIGVVGDTKTQGLDTRPEPAIYHAFWQTPIFYITVLIKTRGEPAATMASARAQVAAIDRALAVFHLMPYSDAIEASAAPARLAARVVTGFALSALVLTMLGIYGAVAYAARGRQRELGIRIALGAQERQVAQLVVRDGLVVAGVGLAVGLAIALAGSRVLRGLLFGIGSTDASAYVVVACALSLLVTLAAWIPARRAARTDPLLAMRPE